MLARRRKMSLLSFYPAQWKSVPHFSLREYTYQKDKVLLRYEKYAAYRPTLDSSTVRGKEFHGL
jgi:hypothetical protein